MPLLNRLGSTLYRPAGAKLLMSIYQDDVRYRRTMAPLLHLAITSGVGQWGVPPEGAAPPWFGAWATPASTGLTSRGEVVPQAE